MRTPSGVLIWLGGLAAVLYEAYAWLTAKRTVSRARGLWRLAIGAWILAFTAHLASEWFTDDLARATEGIGDYGAR